MWKCKSCDAELKSPTKVCPRGGHETGVPSNVILAHVDEPQLEARFGTRLKFTDGDVPLQVRLGEYSRLLRDELSVSLNLHYQSLLSFIQDPRIRYVNLHDNLRGNLIPDYDKELANKRNAIDRMAFGPDGERLNFGAVYLGHRNVGLISYGAACIILKSDEIMCRVSFLENNAFSYYSDSGGAVSFNIPHGSRALWPTLYKLAIIKHVAELFGSTEMTPEEISEAVLYSAGDKSTDRFIEAQIFPPIDRGMIAKIVLSTKDCRKVNAPGLVGETAEHIREILTRRVENLRKVLADEVHLNLPGVKLEVVDNAPEP